MRRVGAGWVLLGLFAALSAGCAMAPHLQHPPVGDAERLDKRVYVVRRGWHIDIGVPVDEASLQIKALAGSFPGARYLLFGLGDRHYLEASHHDASSLLAALWPPGAAVILVTGLSATPTEAFGVQHVIRLQVSPAQSVALQDFVWRSLAHTRTAANSLPDPAVGPYGGSLYYSSDRRYSAANTCNTWAAEGLEQAALPVHSAGVVFAGQLWRQLGSETAGTGSPGVHHLP